MSTPETPGPQDVRDELEADRRRERSLVLVAALSLLVVVVVVIVRQYFWLGG